MRYWARCRLAVWPKTEHTRSCFRRAPDGKRLAVGSTGTIKLWDMETYEDAITLRRGQDAFLALAFSNDGQKLISATATQIVLWSAPNLE
jgi:WD40 repeat protein